MICRTGGYFLVLLLSLSLIGGGCRKEETGNRPESRKVTAENSRTPRDSSIPNDSAQTAEDVQTLIRKGNTYMDSRRYLDAVKSYAKALEITPENADVRIDMGTCYRKMGRPEKAVRAYRQALSYQPNHPNGLANLGVVLAYDLKDLNGAVVIWEKFLSLYPNHNMAASIRQEIQRIRAAKGVVPDNNKP